MTMAGRWGLAKKGAGHKMDVLNRGEAPIHAVEWDDVSFRVTNVARRQLVARRFLVLYGPIGAGEQIVSVDSSPGWDLAAFSMQGDLEDQVPVQRRYQRVLLLAKDFTLDWRDLEQARRAGSQLDWSQAEAAASYVALSEDHLIFHGRSEESVPGLLTVDGRHILQAQDWDKPGSGFHDVTRAISHLTSAGFMPPYSVVTGVRLYAQWHRLYGNSGVLEVEQIQKVAGGGVYQSALIADDTILVIAAGAENMDLAMGIDLQVAFVESTHMNYIFRTMETLSLRIKRPGSICQIYREE